MIEYSVEVLLGANVAVEAEATGLPGQSAYAVAVANGFVGNEAAWLASLQGAAGDDGLSAYEVAVANGFVGNEAAWLASLQGAAGDDGLSAYEVAVANGFVGDEAAWLASLQGAPGADGVDAELIVRQATEDEMVPYNAGAYNDILPASLPAINLEAGAVYTVEIWMRATQGASPAAKALRFTGGTATFTRGHFSSVSRQAALGTITATMASQMSDLLDGVNVVANAGSADWQFHLNGLLVVNTAGTFMPQLSYTAAPGGTITFKAGTYVRLTKVTNYNA